MEYGVGAAVLLPHRPVFEIWWQTLVQTKRRDSWGNNGVGTSQRHSGRPQALGKAQRDSGTDAHLQSCL